MFHLGTDRARFRWLALLGRRRDGASSLGGLIRFLLELPLVLIVENDFEPFFRHLEFDHLVVCGPVSHPKVDGAGVNVRGFEWNGSAQQLRVCIDIKRYLLDVRRLNDRDISMRLTERHRFMDFHGLRDAIRQQSESSDWRTRARRLSDVWLIFARGSFETRLRPVDSVSIESSPPDGFEMCCRRIPLESKMPTRFANDLITELSAMLGWHVGTDTDVRAE